MTTENLIQHTSTGPSVPLSISRDILSNLMLMDLSSLKIPLSDASSPELGPLPSSTITPIPINNISNLLTVPFCDVHLGSLSFDSVSVTSQPCIDPATSMVSSIAISTGDGQDIFPALQLPPLIVPPVTPTITDPFRSPSPTPSSSSTSSSTSSSHLTSIFPPKKLIPYDAPVQKKNLKRAVSDEEEDPVVAQKRLKNTLSARRSRARRALQMQSLEIENQNLKMELAETKKELAELKACLGI